MKSKIIAILLTSDDDSGSIEESSLLDRLVNPTDDSLSYNKDYVPESPLTTESMLSNTSPTTDPLFHRLYNDTIGVFQNVLNNPPNTPLTAHDPDVVTFSSDYDVDGKLLTEGHTSELAWLIPAAIGVILLFVFLALLVYFGIRTLELRLMHFCFRCGCGCCDPRQSGPGKEERVALNTEMKHYDAANNELFD